MAVGAILRHQLPTLARVPPVGFTVIGLFEELRGASHKRQNLYEERWEEGAKIRLFFDNGRAATSRQ